MGESFGLRAARALARFSNEHRIIAEYAGSEVLDVGYAQKPITLFSVKAGIDIEKPRSKPANYGRIVRGDATRLSRYFGRNSFDTIVASNLIEHVENPTEFLRQCSSVLKTKGVLIISTDNPYRWQTLIGNVFLPKGLMSSDVHILYCEPRNLNKMALRLGFELVDLRCGEGLNFPFMQEKFIYVYRKTKSLRK